MKRFALLLSGLMVVTLLFIGCSRKSSVYTGKLESNFHSAEPARKSDADKAVAAIKAGNYSEALTELQQLGRRAKLTAEQQQAVKDVIAQLQKQMTEMANKPAGDAGKAMGGSQKSLPK
jgi:outer membrane protein assembly factor BamD (BamD/ComL family)